MQILSRAAVTHRLHQVFGQFIMSHGERNACAGDGRPQKNPDCCRCIKSEAGKEVICLLFHMVLDYQFKSRHDLHLHI